MADERDWKHFAKMANENFIVSQRRFYIWKLELWWIAFDSVEFHPEGRKHLKGNWFWRTRKLT